MFAPRFKFIGLFAIFLWVTEILFRLTQLLAVPNGPPLNLTREAVEFLVLPALIAVALVFFPVEEERLPIRAVLVSMMIYLAFALSLVLGKGPDAFNSALVPILKYAALIGLLAGLSAFGARKILAARPRKGAAS